ncbi:MAG: protease inhibitor I42 family protein [Rhodothermales bacterium]
MNRLFLPLILVAGLLLPACSSSLNGPLKLREANDGDIINLEVGDMVEVILDGDPSTEVHWIKVPGDPEILEQIGGTDYQADLESHKAERRLTVRFRAVVEGRSRLKLTYEDPSHNPRARDRTFEVWVVVKARA